MSHKPRQIDLTNTEYWAIASIASAGLIVGYSAFLLVNRAIARGHLLHLPTGGLSFSLNASGGTPTYSYFRTRKPANFDDFHGCGTRMTAANVGLGYGKSLVYLDIYDGPVYAGENLAYVEMGSWGPLLPGGSIGQGVTILNWTNGSIRGHVHPIVDIRDHPTSSKPMTRVQTSAREFPRLK